MTDTLQTAELDKILEQAFTDGASDTMWQNDRHVEIYATAKARLQALINSEVTKKLEAVLAVLPDIQNHPSVSDPDIHEVAQAHYDQGWNDLRFLVTTAITNLVAEERKKK